MNGEEKLWQKEYVQIVEKKKKSLEAKSAKKIISSAQIVWAEDSSDHFEQHAQFVVNHYDNNPEK